eukprot:s4881_g5.t1
MNPPRRTPDLPTALFDHLDVNKDGVVTREEWQRAMQAQQPSAVPTQTPVQVQVPPAAGAMMMPPHAAAVPRPGYAAVPAYPPNAGQVVVHQPIPMMKAMSMAPPVGAPVYLQGPGAAVRPMGAPQMAMAMGMPMAQPMPQRAQPMVQPMVQPMAQPMPQMMAQQMVQPMPMQAPVLSGAPLSPQRGLSPPRAVSPMRAAAPMYAAGAGYIPAAQATAVVSGLRAVSPVRSSVSPMRGGVVYSTSTGYTPRMQDLPRHQGEHRVIGERRITREELAETGNLVEVEGSVVPSTERPSSLLMRPVSQVSRVPDPFLPGREASISSESMIVALVILLSGVTTLGLRQSQEDAERLSPLRAWDPGLLPTGEAGHYLLCCASPQADFGVDDPRFQKAASQMLAALAEDGAYGLVRVHAGHFEQHRAALRLKSAPNFTAPAGERRRDPKEMKSEIGDFLSKYDVQIEEKTPEYKTYMGTSPRCPQGLQPNQDIQRCSPEMMHFLLLVRLWLGKLLAEEEVKDHTGIRGFFFSNPKSSGKAHERLRAVRHVLTSDNALAGSTYPYGQNEQVADFGGRVPSPKGDMPGSDMLNFEQPDTAAMYMEPAMVTGQAGPRSIT